MGVNIHEFFRGERPWAQFYRFLNRLPRYGQFYDSLLDNEEDAEALLSRGKSETFGMRDWTYERELLTVLIDEIRSMHRTLFKAHGGKKFPMSPMPRPVTALDRVERRQVLTRHEQRVRLMKRT